MKIKKCKECNAMLLVSDPNVCEKCDLHSNADGNVITD